MIKKLRILSALLTLCTISAFAEPSGWGVGLGVFDSDFGIQGRKDFKFGKELQYAVDLQAGLYNQQKVTTRLNADFHYIFRRDTAFRLYPLAGVNLAIQSKYNRAGFNIGGGTTFDLNSETAIFIEAKYVAGDWDGYALTVGVYF
ncbi:hypothetical protein P4E94_15060 [Pontiellaceae bacterium B12219]|nr:hypothetical protein [Pontiellaceae bacterium B12219]